MVDGEPEFFNAVNHGKESLVADLADPADRPLLEAIVDRADVLVENFRPGTLDVVGVGVGRACTPATPASSTPRSPGSARPVPRRGRARTTWSSRPSRAS